MALAVLYSVVERRLSENAAQLHGIYIFLRSQLDPEKGFCSEKGRLRSQLGFFFYLSGLFQIRQPRNLAVTSVAMQIEQELV
jgi:hypothetical protein